MNPSDRGGLMKQVSRMRKDMDRVREDLKHRYVEAAAGDDLVRVTLNGQQELVKLEIAPRALEPGGDGQVDLEMLEDIVIAAVNQGIEKSKKLMNDEMNEVTGGMASSFPGLF